MYKALYRKKRPTSFKNVVGQQSIVTTLTNQLKSNHISHAYLFCGTRGTGKTSTAKIFARAVNCPYSIDTGEPCNTCSICDDILADRNLNVIEIDAASNNGVDNIRDLREEVKYPPSTGKYKVYIIDEVHMLTTAAFNALLKTLEEPPSHVIFILATTDPQKLPATILSRCQRYEYKRITKQEIVSTLSLYMTEEGVSIDTDALEYIATVSDGAMRDALSILDQCLALYSNEQITLDKLQSLLGAVDLSSLFDFGEALSQSNINMALQIIAKAVKDGRDLSRFTADIINHFRNVLVASQISNHADILDYSQETIERYRRQGLAIQPEVLINYIKEYSELQNQLKYSSQERLLLEVCTIKLCSKNIKVVSAPPQPPQQAVEVPPTMPKTETTEKPEKPENETPPIAPATSPTPPIPQSTPTPQSNKSISAEWQNFCATFRGLIKSMLSLCEVKDGENTTIICRDKGSLQYLKDQKETIAAELKKHFKLEYNPVIVFILNEGYNIQNESKDNFKENLQSQINMNIDFK